MIQITPDGGAPLLINQSELELILNPKIRRRSISLPVRRGKHGELKRPPKVGGVHRLKARVPYERYQAEAQEQPTRARAVLALIVRCERQRREVTITVLAVKRVQESWLITFEKGDQSAVIDRPIYLSKYGDYTLQPSRQAVRGDPEVLMPLAKDLEKARARALERRVHPQREAVQRQASELKTLAESITEMKARQLIQRADRNLTAALRLLPADGDV